MQVVLLNKDQETTKHFPSERPDRKTMDLYQGNRNVKLVDSGVDEELMKRHSMILPRQNVHYAVEILFHEAVFVSLSLPEMHIMSTRYYGNTVRSIKIRLRIRSFPCRHTRIISEITDREYCLENNFQRL